MGKTILIPGGAGYIGSHTAFLLAQKGYSVIVLDKYVHNQVFEHPWAKIVREDFSDTETLHKIFTREKIDAVMHFAAFIEVGESVKQPQKFYDNNVVKTLKLLEIMGQHNVNKFIFSSSCAVYGEPISIPIDETHTCNPISPYGKNKLAVEFALQDYARAYGLEYVSLRYFNAAGNLKKEGLWEQHDPETHIIPLMVRAIKNKTPFKIFGTDYDTPDGTCIRDYIHVLDIADAHIKALEYLDKGGIPDAFNLGSGKGFSVKEMITATEKNCNAKMLVEEESRRPGDPAVLLANPEKSKKILGWEQKHSSLEEILSGVL